MRVKQAMKGGKLCRPTSKSLGQCDERNGDMAWETMWRFAIVHEEVDETSAIFSPIVVFLKTVAIT